MLEIKRRNTFKVVILRFNKIKENLFNDIYYQKIFLRFRQNINVLCIINGGRKQI